MLFIIVRIITTDILSRSNTTSLICEYLSTLNRSALRVIRLYEEFNHKA